MRWIAMLTVFIAASIGLGGCGSESSETAGEQASNGTSNGTTADGTGETSNGTATSNGTTGASNGTTATSNGTTATSNGTTATSNGTTEDPAVTYHRDIRPLMDDNCASCHSEGGAAPFEIDYDPIQWEGPPGFPWWASVSVASATFGNMPPWQPAEGCRDITHSRALSEAEKETFQMWRDLGYPEGNETDYIPPEPTEDTLGEPDLMLDPGAAYTPSRDRPDDYRCILLDHTFDRDTYITATTIVPGDTRIVHHVLIFRVNAEDIEAAEQRDAAEPGLGYTCFGGTGASGGGPVAGWVPGQQPSQYPPGSAVVVQEGSRLIMQIHYNTLGTEEEVSDQTQLALWTMPEAPERQVVIASYPHAAINIPAGEPEDVEERDFLLTSNALVIGSVPHMHTLGTSIQASITHSDGRESCLIDIPKWDFNWQQFYIFPEDAFVTIEPGDRHNLRCVYDNSAANQPIVNGQQIEPRDVRWGEGTFDEMCLNYLIVTTPYQDQNTGQCSDLPDCIRDCDDSTCFLGCIITGEPQCSNCLLGAMNTCSQAECPDSISTVLSCLNTCNGSVPNCLAGACAPELDTLYTCLGPRLEAGDCNGALSDCDVEF